MARRRTALALGGLALVLAGCGVTQAGQAATADTFRIPQSEVDAQVRAVMAQVQDAPGAPPAGLALATTQRLVRDELVAGKAAELGITVSQADVDAGVAELAEQYGGQAGLEQSAAQAGIPADQIEPFVRSNLLIEGITAQSGGDEAAVAAALGDFSEQVDVQVSPRYGTWDPVGLQIVPGSSVATPAEQPETP
ncbi:MAG: SurA N-terminal domain-containing protein [Candidatus Nanopelagicales bacterium]|jgi:hypothetical protein|nr:SurA N-terminal domain-containing protein [Candidatus Nanopelagicales bacterium]